MTAAITSIAGKALGSNCTARVPSLLRRWFSSGQLTRSLLVVALVLTVEGIAAASEFSFSRDVKPILAKRCFACHGPDVRESGFALHDRDALFATPDSGEVAIVPGQPDASELIRRVTSDDEYERMPPDEVPLSSQEVSVLRRWITEGAAYQKHWAFLAPEKQPLPAVNDSNWIVNPIDAFVLAGLESAGLRPAPPADRRTLARRVFFDVTGLPPTTEELQLFLKDDRPDAYERLVDRLLESPRYGEKWARHWLDVVRYAETNSFERDAPKPFVWKYRDYVIRSLNEDKPYDQFVREQLAGDELDEVTADSITATGYYRLGTWDDEPADPLQSKYDDLDNIVSTTSQAFLGLTVGCARCHDHKIDPLPQTDYYGLLSFFADVTPYALTKERDAKHNSLWDLSDPAYHEQREELHLREALILEKQKEIEQQAIVKMEAADQRRSETRGRKQLIKEKLHLYTSDAQLEEYKGFVAELKAVKSSLGQLPPQELVLSLAKCYPRPDTMHVMMRGNPHVLGDPVEPCFPELFGGDPPAIPALTEGARSSGRRRVLADWITSKNNLLSSRVIANRVWQHHFGRGIVRSANNFGQLGTPPTHPELLDWLALWLVENDWKLKPLHRLMLLSNTYRQSSAATPEGLAADPANDLFWRFNMRRLSAEEIRDAVLFVSGQLNHEMYGPSIYPKLSAEVLATQSRPGQGWQKYKPRQAARRSIYIHIKRSLLPPELANFDFPETDTSCEARFNTTQAAQALNLLHGEFLQTQAGYLAQRVIKESSEQLRDRLGHVVRLAMQREPDAATLQDGIALMERYQNQHGLSVDESLRQFCLMVLNLNEFVFLD